MLNRNRTNLEVRGRVSATCRDSTPSLSKGEEKDSWDDMRELIKPCADFILSRINDQINKIKLSDITTKTIKIQDS